MLIAQYILIGVLLISAAAIVVAVIFQKSKEGLSGTITGSSETFYGKDKSAQKDRLLNKWTIILSLIFAVAVLVVYVMQPDYVKSQQNLDFWQQISEYSNIFADK